MNNNVIFEKKTKNNQFYLHSKKFHSLIKFMKDISNKIKILKYLQNKNMFIKDIINSIFNFIKWLYDSNDILIK